MSITGTTKESFTRNTLPAEVWKERLRDKATIRRGSEVITFFVGGHSYSGKHRTSIYKYPESNHISYHRIGDDVSTVSIPGWIVSEDIHFAVNGVKDTTYAYHDVRDRLMAFLRKGGTVMLDHPYLGVMRFFIDSYDVQEEVGEFAYAALDIVGYHVDKRNSREDYSTDDAVSLVEEFAAQFAESVRATADNGIRELQKVGGNPNQPAEVPGWVQRLDKRIDGIDNVAAEIEQIVVSPLKKAQKFLEGATDRIKKVRRTGQRLYAVKREMSRISAQGVGLLYDNILLYNTVKGALNPGFNPFGYIPFSPVEQMAMIAEYAVGIPQNIGADPFTLSFEGIIARIMLSESVITSASIASNATYQSQQDINDVMESVFRTINSYLSYDAITFEEREALMGLKSATVEALYNATILSVKKVKPEKPTPLINIVFKEEGDLNRLVEIAVKNNILNPITVEQEVVI